MSLTINQLRLLALSKRRFVTDAVAWFMLYLLLALILPLLLWHQYKLDTDSALTLNGFVGYVLNENIPVEITVADIMAIFKLIIKDMIWFGLWLIPLVYINLLGLKKYILDYEPPRSWQHPLYLMCVIALSATITGLMLGTEITFSLVRTRMDFIPITIIFFAIALISTGLLWRKESTDVLNQKEIEEQRRIKELEEVQQKLKEVEMTFTQDHIKVGTKNNWDIIRLKEIIYFEGSNNKPYIWTERGKIRGNNRMMDYEDLLPAEEFIRIHRKHIIAKKKVLGRRDNCFLLAMPKNEIEKLPIGETYLKKIEEDDYLGQM